MSSAFFLTLTATGFSVAAVHAAIPTHWLPFVMIGRARGWSRRRTLGAVAMAGGGHILATTVLGVALARFGWEINERYDAAFHWAVAALLVGLGAWLALRAPHGRGCGHCEGRRLIPEPTDRAALWGLFLTLTLSPCELFLPVYLTAAPYGWPGIAWLSAVLAVATLTGLLTLTWIALHSTTRVRWLDRLDGRVLGGMLALLGIATVALPH
jgi:nickel/cobalt exporter